MYNPGSFLKGAFLFCLAGAGVAGEPDETSDPANPPVALDSVDVIGVTPVGGAGVPVDLIPSPVQTVTGQELQDTQSINVTDYMRRYLGSVSVNDVQNNPFQPDVQYRGFTASPLLGLPQGLAVYFNGIRFNEPFGDTVNWDLIPEGAIDQMSLHSGSNAVYGLNALGGALAVKTKTGFSAPGHQIEVNGGAWGRHSEELRSGWNDGSLAYFIDLRSFIEDGWRDFSPTDVKQAFGTFGWRNERAEVNLTLAANDNKLLGNGAIPIQLARQDWEAVFTHPDETVNRFFFSTLDGNVWLNDRIQLAANAYFRQNRIRTFNGDDTDYGACEDPAVQQFLCDDEGEGEPVEDTNGHRVRDGASVNSATNNRSRTNQRSYGGSAQVAWEEAFFDLNNRLVAGGSYDEARVKFGFDTELAALTPDRGTIGSGIFVEEPEVRLKTRSRHYGIYLTDTLNVTKQLALTAAGRYNLSLISLDDQIGEELNGFHKYDRFNPSAGLTYSFLPELKLYGGYSESNRAPTPVELSCADPDAPCKLPNAFVADPALKQVVAKTWEAGFRGQFHDVLGGTIGWNFGLFQTENHDDILFISAGDLTNEGYFDNVGKTRRRGLEMGLEGNFERIRVGLNYTLLDATFRTPFVASSPNNPSAVDDLIFVEKGDRIPGLPRNMLKFAVDGDILPNLTVGLDMIYNGGQYFRGDEANLNRPLDGYAVVNLYGEYRYDEHFTMFARISNLFDERYYTFGLYGEADEVLGDAFDDPRFVGVGSPLAGWVGVRLSL